MSLKSSTGTVFATRQITGLSSSWKKFTFTLAPTVSAANDKNVFNVVVLVLVSIGLCDEVFESDGGGGGLGSRDMVDHPFKRLRIGALREAYAALLVGGRRGVYRFVLLVVDSGVRNDLRVCQITGAL